MGKKIMVSESCVQGKFFFGKATRHQPQNNRRREAVSMHRKKNGRTVIQIKNDASGGRKRERDFSPPPASPTPGCTASKSRACKHRSLGVESETGDTDCL